MLEEKVPLFLIACNLLNIFCLPAMVFYGVIVATLSSSASHLASFGLNAKAYKTLVNLSSEVNNLITRKFYNFCEELNHIGT